MAVTTATMYKEMYLGQMSPEQAELILNTRGLESIPNLKKMIFNFPPELVLRSLEENKSIRRIIQEENIDYKPYQGELRDYQTVGTAFMYLSPRSIIADGVGMGKTAEVAGLINYLKEKGEITRFLIAVETSALGQTQAELIKFTGLNVVQLPSETAKLKKLLPKIDWSKVDGIVIKHSTLRNSTFSKWIALNINDQGTCNIFNTFFLDESSVIKNTTTKMYEYTKNIANLVGRVHFMNATAFETNLMDVYNQLDMMNPVLLPKKWRIEKEYCSYGRSSYWTKVNGEPKMNWRRDLNGYKNQEHFKQSLKLVYFGRAKKNIGHEYIVYEVEPTVDQTLAINKKYRYAEVLNCPSLVKDINIPTTRKTVPKLERLCTLIDNDFHESSVMVYAFHLEAQRAIYEEMVKMGRKPVILNGACTDEERYKAQQGFNNGTYDIIITNIMKSLNLYGGDALIFYSLQGNPSKMEQIRGRIDRSVDDSIKTFVLLIYRGTDEYNHFMNVVRQRAEDSRSLTIDAKTAVDYFIESMKEQEGNGETDGIGDGA